ncbi:hypothetical protein MPSEU_000668300 [Mayamaea pseudoterrestris]|nr:hypothetical protein MPSEU_000668300 [Mayamaea pseudoterrestris]
MSRQLIIFSMIVTLDASQCFGTSGVRFIWPRLSVARYTCCMHHIAITQRAVSLLVQFKKNQDFDNKRSFADLFTCNHGGCFRSCCYERQGRFLNDFSGRVAIYTESSGLITCGIHAVLYGNSQDRLPAHARGVILSATGDESLAKTLCATGQAISKQHGQNDFIPTKPLKLPTTTITIVIMHDSVSAPPSLAVKSHCNRMRRFDSVSANASLAAAV